MHGVGSRFKSDRVHHIMKNDWGRKERDTMTVYQLIFRIFVGVVTGMAIWWCYMSFNELANNLSQMQQINAK